MKSKETNADLYSANHMGAEGLISCFKKIEAFEKTLKQKYNTENEELSFFDKAKGYYYKWTERHPRPQERIAVLSAFTEEKSANKMTVTTNHATQPNVSLR